MKRFIILIGIMLLAGTLFSCSSESSYIKRVEKINGKTYYILDDTKNSEKDKKVNNRLSRIETIGSAEYAFYLEKNYILYIEATYVNSRKGSYTAILYNTNTERKAILFRSMSMELYNFQISPGRNKLLYVDSNLVNIINIDTNTHITFGLRNNSVKDSVTWKDNNSIVYSCSDGSIYEENINDNSETAYEGLEYSLMKNIKYIGGKLLYMSYPLPQQNFPMDNTKYSHIYAQNEIDKGNSLDYTDETSNGTILDWVGKYNIKAYCVSPDGKNIALFFEDDSNNSKLFIANIEDDLYTSNISDRGYIHVSNEKLSTMAWSNDSKRLAYATKSGSQGLYIVNNDGTDNNMIVGYTSIDSIDWSNDSNLLLFTQNVMNSEVARQIWIVTN